MDSPPEWLPKEVVDFIDTYGPLASFAGNVAGTISVGIKIAEIFGWTVSAEVQEMRRLGAAIEAAAQRVIDRIDTIYEHNLVDNTYKLIGMLADFKEITSEAGYVEAAGHIWNVLRDNQQHLGTAVQEAIARGQLERAVILSKAQVDNYSYRIAFIRIDQTKPRPSYTGLSIDSNVLATIVDTALGATERLLRWQLRLQFRERDVYSQPSDHLPHVIGHEGQVFYQAGSVEHLYADWRPDYKEVFREIGRNQHESMLKRLIASYPFGVALNRLKVTATLPKVFSGGRDSGWKQVAVGSENNIWAVSNEGDVFRLDNETIHWRQVQPGIARLDGISVSADGNVWGTSGQDIYRWNPGGSQFVRANGNAVNVAVGSSGDVWAIDALKRIYHKTTVADSDWTPIRHGEDSLESISVSADGSAWGLAGSRTYRFNHAQGKFELSPEGRAISLSVESRDHVWAVGANGTLYHKNLEGDGWTPVAGIGNLAQVSVGADGTMWGVDQQSKVWVIRMVRVDLGVQF